jgi:hypothetical protein
VIKCLIGTLLISSLLAIPIAQAESPDPEDSIQVLSMIGGLGLCGELYGKSLELDAEAEHDEDLGNSNNASALRSTAQSYYTTAREACATLARLSCSSGLVRPGSRVARECSALFEDDDN